MTAKKLATISIIIFLAGCAEPVPPKPDTSVNSDDAAQVKLAEAAVSVSNSLTELAQMEKAIHPAAPVPTPPDPNSIGMGQLASVNWTGPIEPLIRKIAGATHYRVRVLGKSPAIPAIVSINAHNIPLADILRDASFQAAKKVDVVLYPRRRIIELRYL